jgi:hypothetical protein
MTAIHEGPGMFWKANRKRTRGNWTPGAAGSRGHRRARCPNLYSNIGRVVDLSPTGAGLLTEPDAFRPGMRDTFRLDTGGRAFETGATVVWVRREDRCDRLGLRFEPLADAARREIRALCERLREDELDRRESAYA